VDKKQFLEISDSVRGVINIEHMGMLLDVSKEGVN
jgi:hypothetical protein